MDVGEKVIIFASVELELEVKLPGDGGYDLETEMREKEATLLSSSFECKWR